jgi:hypothetical protein
MASSELKQLARVLTRKKQHPFFFSLSKILAENRSYYTANHIMTTVMSYSVARGGGERNSKKKAKVLLGLEGEKNKVVGGNCLKPSNKNFLPTVICG